MKKITQITVLIWIGFLLASCQEGFDEKSNRKAIEDAYKYGNAARQEQTDISLDAILVLDQFSSESESEWSDSHSMEDIIFEPLNRTI